MGEGHLGVRGGGNNSDQLWNLVQSAIALLGGLAGFLYLLGQVVTRVRLAAAHVPVDAALATTDLKTFLGAGLSAVLLEIVVFVGFTVAAYVAAGWRWKANGWQWHALMVQGVREARSLHTRADAKGRLGVLAPAGDRLVRIVAGYNILVIAAAIGLAVATGIEHLHSAGPWGAIAFVVVLVAVIVALTSLGPLRVSAPFQSVGALIVLATALLSLASIGMLMIAALATAALGRLMVRVIVDPARDLPRSISGFVRSPYPWALLVIYALVPMANVVTPPVGFPLATITTTHGQETGGYLTRTAQGISLVACTPLADATSFNEHVLFIEDSEISSTTLRGGDYLLDQGDRPSLATLAMSAIGLSGHARAVFPPPRFNPQQPTCNVGAAPPVLATEMPSLGDGVLVGPANENVAHDGERPIMALTAAQHRMCAAMVSCPQQTTPTQIAQLALRYQPTIEVTVADGSWPVSVGAVLTERGAHGEQTCLVRQGAVGCAESLASLQPFDSSRADYLRYPVALGAPPTTALAAFERGQQIYSIGSLHDWLSNPGVLEPWYTAQVYFYYAGPIGAQQWPSPARDPSVLSGLIGLEYWFFYPYSYFPSRVKAGLMNDAPLAADLANTAIRQGDWEHVTVLLDPVTRSPVWLYMARHGALGQFVPWNSFSLAFDGTHPIIQAAFGDHAPYDNHCGARPLLAGLSGLNDWIVCGSGRFAFRGATTPLVDLGSTVWACWRGHFGGVPPASSALASAQSVVSGPVSPLLQGENASTGACTSGNPRRAELAGALLFARPRTAPVR
jgi:hypothetical protein